MRREELETKTKQELLELARRRQIAGRTQMSKEGLVRALLKSGARGRAPAFAPRARPKAKPAPRRAASAKPAAKKTAQPKAPARAPRKPAKKATPRAASPRAVRGGPFGPESEKLHGAAVAPPVSEIAGNGRPAPRPALGAPLAMPERYGRDYAALMVRDPHWLHAYWEVTPDSVEALRRRLGSDWDDHRWVMRVFVLPPDAEPGSPDDDRGADRYDVDLPYGAHNWNLNVGRPDRACRVAIGVLTRSGEFHALARSNTVRLPRDGYSPVTDEEWTTLPEALRALYASAAEAGVHGRSSAELGLLLRERLRADWSSGMLGSMASGVPLRPEAERADFWFVLDAELIVYGATEPDARVTVQGRPVALRPDGTFTLRFQLPDGTQVIDATAVSSDGVFRKTVTPTVRRETHATEMIETRAES